MVHRGLMTVWPEITCQRGHDGHTTKQVQVTLGGDTGYHDLPPIPDRLSRSFKMVIWDTEVHPIDGGIYCPAHDAVSATIASHGVWEPRETILTLDACSRTEPGAVMLDFGAQIGWFSLLAASCGLEVHAYDADADNLGLLTTNAKLNGWEDRMYGHMLRVTEDTPVLSLDERIALAKIDVEGAEPDVIRILGPMIDAQKVERLLIEVSPVFHDGYPDLVVDLIGRGFRAYKLPPKHRPPHPLALPDLDMLPFRLDDMSEKRLRSLILGFHQEDLWFVRKDLRL